MKLQLVGFPLAKLLKEVGFKPDKPSTDYVHGYYSEEESNTSQLFEMQEEDYCRCDYYLAPTLELAKMWFREKHKILVSCYPAHNAGELWYCEIEDLWLSNDFNTECLTYFDTYEAALEAGLIKACELIKTK